MKKAVDVIKQGGLVIFPTETVYGLGADALNPRAVKKIFKVKGRPVKKALIIHVSKKSTIDVLAKDIPRQARMLVRKYWPGPLTLVLKKKKIVPGIVTGGGDTVAIRMPDHPLALKLIRAAGPIVGPSANFYGKKPPRTVKEISPKLLKSVDAVLDGGKAKTGIPSTVVDFTKTPPKIVRKGSICGKIEKYL